MSTFEARRKSLFEQLSEAEKKFGYVKTDTSDVSHSGEIDRRTYRKLKNEMKQFRGRESIYKRAETPLKHCLARRSQPEFVMNPDKWTYYSLENVTDEDLSERTNTATALAILKQFEEREATFNMEDDNKKTIFKKPTFRLSATVKQDKNDVSKQKFVNRKVIMPEYIVGVTKPARKEKLSHNLKSDIKSNLKLEHLFDNEDE